MKCCYCAKCCLKKVGYTEQTGQQLKYHLANYGIGPNHPQYKRILTPINNSSVLVPATSTPPESTNHRCDLSKSISNNTRNHQNDEGNSPEPDQGLSRQRSFDRDDDFKFPDLDDSDFEE